MPGSRSTVLTSVLLGVLLPGVALGGVQEGLDFLDAARAPDGSHGAVPLRDTAAAAASFRSITGLLSPTSPEAIFAWTADPGDLDGQAYRLLTLGAAGELDPEGAAALLDRQNGDGGFALFDGFGSGSLETALALRALATSGQGSIDQLSRAVDFLRLQQDADGGFGHAFNDPHIQVTSEVLLALGAVDTLFDVAEMSGAAADWLVAQQNEDGSFGVGALPLVDSSLSTLALLSVGGADPDVEAALTLGIGALQAAQQSDGSWGGDPYTSALALGVIGGEKPNLGILSLEVFGAGGAAPVEGEPATLTLTVDNDGRLATRNTATITLHRVLADGVTLQLLGTLQLEALEAGGTETLTLPWDTTGVAGDVYLKVSVDTLDRVAEGDEGDNTLYVGAYLIPRVDLAITDADLDLLPEDAGLAEEVRIGATVHNRGGTDAEDFTVSFYQGDPAAGGALLHAETISLAALTSVELAYQALFPKGEYDVVVIVDSGGVIRESLENNNRAQAAFNVSERYDFAGSFERIWASPSEVIEPGAVNVTAVFYNLREDDAEDVVFQCYVYNPDLHDELADRVAFDTPKVAPSIPGDGSATVSCTFPTEGYSGRNYIYVVADPEDAIPEVREDNNEAIVTVTVYRQPNLKGDLISASSSVTEGSATNMYGRFLNTGGVTLQQVPVAIFIGDPDAGGVRLSPDAVITSIAPGATANSTTLSWDTTGWDAGTYNIVAVADPEGLLDEYDETDNRVSKAITVNPRADLQIIAEDIVFSDLSPEEGDALTVTATVRNIVATTASGTFYVRIYDGDPAAGGVLLKEQSYSSLSGNRSVDLVLDFVTSDAVGAHPLFVTVDEEQTINERFRENNAASRLLTIAASARPDPSVALSDVTLTPPRGVPPGGLVEVAAVIRNLRNRPADDVTLRLYGGDPRSGALPATGDLTLDIPALGEVTAVFNWTTPGILLDTELYLLVDPDDSLAETNELNNEVSFPYKGRQQPGTEPLNLAADVDYRTVSLTWDLPAEGTPQGYGIYRNGERLNPPAAMDPGVASADSVYRSGYEPDKAFDDNTGSYWLSESHGAPWWLAMTLDEPQVLTEIYVYWYSSYRAVNYEIQGFNGAGWETLATVTGNSDNEVTTPLTRSLLTDEYRIYVTFSSSSTYAGIREVDLVGFEGFGDRAFVDADLLEGDYTYVATAYGANTFESPDSDPASVSLAGPPPPGDLVATPDFSRVDLTWSAASDPGFVSFLVYRDGALLNPDATLPQGGLTASASSSYNSSYTPDKAIDGSTSTYWFNISGQFPAYYELDLGDQRLISAVDLLWQPSYRGIDYDIEAWDGDEWVRLLSVRDNADTTVRHPLPRPYPSDRLRLAMTRSASTSYVGIYEINVDAAAPQTGTTFADTHLLAREYVYSVAPLNRLGEQGAADVAAATVPDPQPPSALSLTPSQNQMAMTWPEVDNDTLTSYLVYRGDLPLQTSIERQSLEGTTALASSTRSSSYPASNAIDGSSSTYWQSESTSASPIDFEVILPETQVVTGLEIDGHSSYPCVDYDVDAFNGKVWQTLVSVEDNADYILAETFEPFATDRVRIRCWEKLNSSYLLYYEVRVLGFAPLTDEAFTDTAVPTDTYDWGVRVLNGLGEASAPRLKTGTLYLAPPTSFVAVVDGDNVGLTWDIDGAAPVVGYRLLRSGQLLAEADTAVDLGEGIAVGDASSLYNTSYTADKALDGATNTQWIGLTGAATWWYEVTLPAPRELMGISVDWASSRIGEDFVIQRWDGAAWAPILAVEGNGSGYTTHTFPEVLVTDRLRIFITDATSTNAPGIDELEIHGPALITDQSYADLNVPVANHTYTLYSVDPYGGRSEPVTASATMSGALVAPDLQSAVASGSQVNLAWAASPSSGVQGYWVYRDGARIGDEDERASIGTAIASDVASTSTSYQASNANDGSTSTRWRSDSSGPWTLELAWPDLHKLDRIDITWGSAAYPTRYRIETWTGSGWHVEAEVSGNVNSRTVDIPDNMRTSTRLRVTILESSGSYVELYEIDAFEPRRRLDLAFTDSVIFNRQYAYCVKAVGEHVLSACSNALSVDVAEGSAPAQVAGGRVSGYTRTNITLAWDPNTEYDLWGYNVYFEGSDTPLNSVPITTTTYTHSSVIVPETLSYTYVVKALDLNENEGPGSAPIVFAPAPLAPPSGLDALKSYANVELTWDAHPDPLFVSYSIYRNDQNIARGLTTRTFTDVHPGEGTWVYQISAVDRFEREGALSAGVTVELTDMDLVVSDPSLFFQPQVPSELYDVKLHVSVRNDGGVATTETTVAFYDGEPEDGGALIAEVPLGALEPGALGVVEYAWELEGQAGDHTIVAVVDPLDEVAEFAEDNNVARKALTVTEVPELQVSVNSVDASAFPQIQLKVDVRDPSGEDVVGLDERSIRVQEDGVLQSPLDIFENAGADATEPIVDVVFLVDSSGSMSAEWQVVPTLIERFTEELFVRGINTQSEVFSLGSSYLGYPATTNGTYNGAPFNAGSEDWCPAVTWHCTDYGWRPNAVKIVIPMGDENPYQGGGYNDADEQTIVEASAVCADEEVFVFPLWGDGAPTTLVDSMERLGAATEADAFYYLDINEVLDFMTLSVLSRVSRYVVTYDTNNPIRDGSERLVDLTADYRGAEGTGEGTYIAPADAIQDLHALSLRTEPGTPALGQDTRIVGAIKNESARTLTSVPAQIIIQQAGRGPIVLGGMQDLGPLAQGATAEISAQWQGMPGAWTLSVVADPERTIPERSEDNNVASKTLRIPGAVGYELAVYADEIALSAQRPMKGDRLTVTGVVHNFGIDAANVLVQLYSGDPAAGGQQVGEDVVIPFFGASTSKTLTFQWDTTGLVGERSLYFLVDPFDRLDEISEANNVAIKALTLEQPPYEIFVDADRSQYGANAPATFTARVVNHSTGSFIGDVRFDVEGALIEGDAIVAGTATIDELVGNPFPDWRYALTVTAPAQTASRVGALMSVGIDAPDLLLRLGAAGTFDPSSVRVAQHDPTSFKPLATFPARFVRGPEGEGIGKVVFETLPVPDFSGAQRVYRIYFDTLDAGHGALTSLPPEDGLIAMSDEDGRVRFARRGADGAFGEAIELEDRDQRIRALAVADVNGDGLSDILAADYIRRVLLYPGEEGGGFGPAEIVYQGTSSGDVRYLEAADMDGDGDVDFLWCLSSTPELFRNQGDGTFVAEAMGSAGTTPYAGQVVDLDSDGDLDLILGLNGGRFSWYENLGGGTFEAIVQLFQVSGNAPYGLAVGDYDGDGAVDLVFNDGSTGRGYFAKGLGGANFAAPVRNTSADTAGYGRFDSLDYNNDGLLDLLILAAGSSASPVELRPGTGTGAFGLAQVVDTLPKAAYGAAAGGLLELGVQSRSAPFENLHPEVEVSVPWNTRTLRAGTYAAVGHLLEGGTDERGLDSKGFSIGSVRALMADVDTDWPEYVPGERAIIEALLENTTLNDAVQPTEGLISVLDPEGAEVFTDLYTLSEMEPGERVRWEAEQDLYGAAPGTYTVRLFGLSEGVELGFAETFFEVLGLDALEGALVADPGQVLEGDSLTLTYTVRNRGTSAVAGLPIFLRIQDAESEEVRESYSFNVSLDPDEQTGGAELQGTESLGLGTFDALLGAVVDGQEIVLAQARFIVINITGSLAVEPEVAEGGVESLTFDWGVRNRGDVALSDLNVAIVISQEGVPARTSLQPWVLDLDAQAEASGASILDSAELAIGVYEATLVNTREEGSITLAEVSFTVQDTIAPLSTLRVSGAVVEGDDGTLYAPYETRYILEATDNFSGVAAIRYDLGSGSPATYSVPIQFVSDGARALSYSAVDVAGVEESPHLYAVVVDGTAPVITLGAVSDSGCIGADIPLTFAVADLSPTVTTATLDGEAFESGGIVGDVGSHTVVITATDILGHTSEETFTFDVTDDPCACAGETATADADGDGIPTCEGDCDDTDADIFPGAPEICDGLDNDCDGVADNDGDGDGYGTCEDCDDQDPGVSPEGTEVENGADDDCDGRVDEALCVDDADGDGFTGLGGDCALEDSDIHPGASEAPEGAPDGIDNDCDGAVDEGTDVSDDDGDGYSEAEGDCDDHNPLVGPEVPEEPGSFFYGDGIDNDCDGVVDDGAVADGDGDGYLPSGGDCDDADPSIYPGAPEDGGAGTGIADGKDNNCDGRLDEQTDLRDDDFDGFSELEGDCDDGNFAIHPEAVEIFDGVDEDCDGTVDEGSRPCDSDGDGFAETDGDCDDTDADINPDGVEVCDGDDNDCDGETDEDEVCREDADGDGFSGEEGDCDDGDAAINPDADEICDGEDNDCDGETDEDEVCRVDADGDGYSPEGGDCDDRDAGINPDASEVCDGVDQDCDGAIDEGVPTQDYYPDGDGDGYGDAEGAPVTRCAPEPGEVAGNTDCDDGDADVNPGIALDNCGDVDDDCDGEVDEDCDVIPDDTPTGDVGTPGGGENPECGCRSTPGSEAGSWMSLLLMALAGLYLRPRLRRG